MALSLVCGAEHGLFEDIRKLVEVPIPTEVVEGYEPTEPLSRDAGKTNQRNGGGQKRGGGGQRRSAKGGGGNRGGNSSRNGNRNSRGRGRSSSRRAA